MGGFQKSGVAPMEEKIGPHIVSKPCFPSRAPRAAPTCDLLYGLENVQLLGVQRLRVCEGVPETRHRRVTDDPPPPFSTAECTPSRSLRLTP